LGWDLRAVGEELDLDTVGGLGDEVGAVPRGGLVLLVRRSGGRVDRADPF